MSLAFITVKDDAVIGANAYIPVIPDKNAFTSVLDDTDTGVKDLFENVNSYLFSDIMKDKPYISASYDGETVKGVLNNAPFSVPKQATVSFHGVSYPCSMVNGQFSLPIRLHPAIETQHLTVSMRVDGFPYTFIEIGGRDSNVEVQVYQDSTGVQNIVPAKNSDLANYYQNRLVDMTWTEADLATVTGLLVHTLFQYIMPALNLSLSEQEQNALKDIQANILPNVVSNLSNIIPDGINPEIHYNSYRLHIQQAKTAMDKYVADRIEISKYTTLK